MPKVMIDMEMPKSCWGCKFSQINAIQNTSICLLQAITNRDPWDPPSIIDKGKKDDNCPLQEVKE